MLKHLHISNYALIDSLDVDFTPGLTTITGETGAGKSIMLGALSLLSGQRADRGKVSAGEAKTIVEAVFDIAKFPHLAALLDELDIEAWPDSEMLMRREMTASGRTRAFINDTPVSLATMSRVAEQVIDIHSQHANLLIGNPRYQLGLLDAYADNATLREQYLTLYNSYRELRSRITTLKEQAAHARENEEFIAFRLEHLRKLKPVAGEQARLEACQQLLGDASAISESLGKTVQLLSASEDSVLDELSRAASLLRGVNLSLFDADSDIVSRIESARIDLADVSAALEGYMERVEADPSELERVEQRLDRLYEAQRRFDVSCEQELIDLQAQLEKEYASLNADGTDIAELEKQLHSLGAELKEAARLLSDSRLASASEITARLTEMAKGLGLPNLRVALTLTPGKLTSTGADTPALLVAFNKNQELRPLQEVASGGEISRMMLCLKALMARRMNLPTIIFDEVDTGVSGDIADRMGALMSSMAGDMQVLTITHLPQVAAKGQTQFKVYKQDSIDATHTRMRLLTATEREDEIAAMLSGSDTTEAARLNARALLWSNNPNSIQQP